MAFESTTESSETILYTFKDSELQNLDGSGRRTDIVQRVEQELADERDERMAAGVRRSIERYKNATSMDERLVARDDLARYLDARVSTRHLRSDS